MYRCLIITLLALSAPLGQASAQDFLRPGLVPHNEARDASRKGDMISLSNVSRNLARQYGGELLDASLYSDGRGGYYYDVKWLAGSGSVLKLRVDAANGRVLRSNGG